jgi:hypothetical protein
MELDWGAVYAHIITSTGYTYEYVDDYMTLPRLAELQAYWKDTPPVHVSLAMFLRSLASSEGTPTVVGSTAPPQEAYGDLNELAGMFPGGHIATR